MRRPAAVILGTILGSALLVGARLGAHPAGAQTVISGPAEGDGSAGRAAGPDAPVPSGSSGPGPTGRPATGATPRPGETTPSVGVTKAPSTPANPGGGGSTLSSGTFTGTAVTHRYGTLQVTITVSGGRITTIVESYKTSLRTSAKINADAIPVLRQSALAAQSATIDTVSGATYTSDAYRASLRSALDRSRT